MDARLKQPLLAANCIQTLPEFGIEVVFLRGFYNRTLGLLRNMRWSGYPLHTASAIWVRNMLRKARTLSLCCGNNGQPGC